MANAPTLRAFNGLFPDEAAARRWFEAAVRWNRRADACHGRMLACARLTGVA